MTATHKGEKPLIMGIDPGLSGAICLVKKDTLSIEDMYDMPTKPVKPGSSKLELDLDEISMIFEVYSPEVELCVLEKVHSMPKQGVASTFKFGEGSGALQGLLKAHGIDTIRPRAAVWKLSLGLTNKKDASRKMAKKVFPLSHHYFKLAKHHDRAEAALLCHWAIKMNVF